MPGGTQSGRRFRLTGKGMPVLRSKQTGDMYVQVVVETPQSLTKRQRELLTEFEKLSSQDTQPEASGFFAKVKDFFGNSAPVPHEATVPAANGRFATEPGLTLALPALYRLCCTRVTVCESSFLPWHCSPFRCLKRRSKGASVF